jgi:hypothetical protein
MSESESMVQVLPADQAAAVRNFEPAPAGKRKLKHQETVAEHDARLYGSDPISQHIKKYDVNGDGQFELGEVKRIIEELEKDEAQVKSLKKVVAGVVFVSLVFMGVMMGIILGANELSKETHAKGGVMEDLKGNAVQVDTVSAVGTLLDLPDYDAETMKSLKSITFEPIVLEAVTRQGEDEDNTTIETTFYEQLHNVTVFMNVIGFQKSANQITLHGGFNGQSVTVKGDYASYTVGGESYTINTKAEADSRRRLDDHHAREGGERMFLFEDSELMHEYHDEIHRIVDVTPTDLDHQHGRKLIAKDAGFHRRRLATVGNSNFKTRTKNRRKYKPTVAKATWAPFPKFFVELGRTRGRTWPILEPTSRCVSATWNALPKGTFTPYQNLDFGVRCCAGNTITNPRWKTVKGKNRGLNWAQAQQACADVGYTLCTRNQIAKADDRNGFLGDGNDNRMVWSSTPCGGTNVMRKFLARFGWGQKVKEMTNKGFSNKNVADPTAPDPSKAVWIPFDYFFVYIGREKGRTNAIKASQKQMCLRADKTTVPNAPFKNNKQTGTFCCDAKKANNKKAGLKRVKSPKGLNWAGAMQQCANEGLMLCTRDQIKYASQRGIKGYSGENLDNHMIWSSTPCNMIKSQQKYMTRFGWGQGGNGM